MHLFTTWKYFIVESLTLAAGACTSSQRCLACGVCCLFQIRVLTALTETSFHTFSWCRQLPSSLLWGHLLVHVVFTIVSAAAPQWTVDQNIQRINVSLWQYSLLCLLHCWPASCQRH